MPTNPPQLPHGYHHPYGPLHYSHYYANPFMCPTSSHDYAPGPRGAGYQPSSSTPSRHTLYHPPYYYDPAGYPMPPPHPGSYLGSYYPHPGMPGMPGPTPPGYHQHARGPGAMYPPHPYLNEHYEYGPVGPYPLPVHSTAHFYEDSPSKIVASMRSPNLQPAHVLSVHKSRSKSCSKSKQRSGDSKRMSGDKPGNSSSCNAGSRAA